jgi:Winged helix DNA-binding domain
MKALEVARWRMRNSGLVGSSFETPDEVVRWHGAMQAQDYGPAKWSIGQRATNLVDEDVERALAAGSIVRTHVLRPTWHFVAPDDVRWMLALTAPRVHQHNGPRYRELELDKKTLARCEAVIASALEGGNHLTRDAIGSVLDGAGIDRSGQRLPYILMHCELEAVIGSGGRTGKQQTYALLDERVSEDGRFDRDQALAELARRYLTSHGPATIQDLRWWSGLTVADIKKALHMLGSVVENETVEGFTFWSMGADSGRAPSARGVHLLQTYDELVVGYAASRYFGDPRAADLRAAWRDRSRPNGVVLLNGRLAGHWRRRVDRDSIAVEVLAFEHPGATEAWALKAAAERLGRFLRRPATLEATLLP